MNFLQTGGAHTSLQLYRRKSNRFGKNVLTDACRAVFSKQAAPRSHAFFGCHEPLPPDTRCGELRGGLSSHPPGMARNLRPVEAAAESASLHRMKTARSTEFPLRRLAVRGCERTMSEAKRRAPMRSIGDRISGAAECQGDCGAIEPTKPPTAKRISVLRLP